MNQERIQKLKVFLEDSPEDPFLLYALANEYKTLDVEKAKYYYDKLLMDHPTYLGTYYHAAALYAENIDRVKAERIYLKGIELAKQQSENNALRELENAYLNFQFDE